MTLLEALPLLIGSGGPQKPFSWLSEGVRALFTVNTETGEMTCVPTPHPRDHHVLVGNWCELLARESMQRVQRNGEQAKARCPYELLLRTLIFHAL